jgi:HEXXH motif-containing protein
VQRRSPVITEEERREAHLPSLRRWNAADPADARWLATSYQGTLAAIARRRAADLVDIPPASLAGPSTAYFVHVGSRGPADGRAAAAEACRLELASLAKQTDTPPAIGVAVTCDTALLSALEALAAEFETATGRDPGSTPLLPAGPAVVEAARTRMAEATGLLDRLWPEYGEELAWHVRLLVVAGGDSLISASLAAAHGAVFVNESLATGCLPLYESLLHEGSHHVLSARMTLDPMLTNPEDLATSPLRPDPRPLRGILHAVFVTVRMAHGFARLYDADLSDRWTRHAERRLAAYDRQITSGLAILRQHGRFTPVGKSLVDSLATRHEQLYG